LERRLEKNGAIIEEALDGRKPGTRREWEKPEGFGGRILVRHKNAELNRKPRINPVQKTKKLGPGKRMRKIFSSMKRQQDATCGGAVPVGLSTRHAAARRRVNQKRERRHVMNEATGGRKGANKKSTGVSKQARGTKQKTCPDPGRPSKSKQQAEKFRRGRDKGGRRQWGQRNRALPGKKRILQRDDEYARENK